MNINGPKGALLSIATALVGAAVKKGHAVKRGADVEHVIHGTAGAQCIGIAVDDQDTAERTVPYAFMPGERVIATAGAAFAADALLKSDGTGKLVTAVAGELAIAKALEAAGADLDMVCVEILPQQATGATAAGVAGIAAGYKIARGQHETIDADDTVVTGLATVVSVVASMDDDPVDGAMHVTATIGDQDGAPAAGSIQIKTWKSTDGDATLIAATTFTKKVNWIAVGT